MNKGVVAFPQRQREGWECEGMPATRDPMIRQILNLVTHLPLTAISDSVVTLQKGLL